MRLAGRVGLLVALWLLAWGEVTLANVVSGLVVAAALLVAFPRGSGRPGHLRIRPGGLARLAAHVATQLVLSNLVMAREVVRRHPTARPGVLRHQLGQPSDEVVTLMTSVISLSPGTMTVDVERDSSALYVHFYSLTDVDAARAVLERLEGLVVDAVAARPAGVASVTTTGRTTGPPEDPT